MNDYTVLSIFVNPAQFAPHEDLGTYPRTLPRDLELLAEVSHRAGDPTVRKASAVFLPAVQGMYPSGITQDVAAQQGTFVEVKGFGHQMEGQSRPTFFRGVATIVTKLFNAVEVWPPACSRYAHSDAVHQPTRAYFGQKDIQQALLLRRMCRDLLLAHPEPENVHIVPTTRHADSGLALSSRNAYLTDTERPFAPTLYRALKTAEARWDAGAPTRECVSAATDLIYGATGEAHALGVKIELDYVQMTSADTFETLGEDERRGSDETRKNPVIISGAVWIGKTRLIDNVLLSENGMILLQDWA